MENNKVIDTMFNKKDNILIIIWQKGAVGSSKNGIYGGILQ